jgi:hypothetical protein
MSTSNSFPQLDLRVLKIRDQLDLVSDQTILGYSIRYALITERPLHKVIEDILDAYADNQEAVLDIVGADTMKLIGEVYGKNFG